MTPIQVQEFILKHEESVVKYKIEQVQRKNREEAFNLGLAIITEQMRLNTLMAFGLQDI